MYLCIWYEMNNNTNVRDLVVSIKSFWTFGFDCVTQILGISVCMRIQSIEYFIGEAIWKVSIGQMKSRR